MALPAITGSLPLILYKFYKKQEWAQAFVNDGRIRLNSLIYYTCTKDKNRRDKTEGEGQLQVPGDVPMISLPSKKLSYKPDNFDYSEVSLNPTFLFCMSGPNVNLKYASEKFGSFVVEIYNVDSFIKDIAEVLPTTLPNGQQVTNIECLPIRYDKNAPGTLPERSLAYSQKSPEYAPECEFRLVVQLDSLVQAPKCLYLKINGSKNYARLKDS